jgi:hypothetical protein
MSGEIGYLNLAAADAYFATRLASDAWTTIPVTSARAKETAALTTAYNRLFYSGLFNIPSFAAASADELVILQKAQCELALYMLIHLADEDRRLGLQAQGVTVAGIVKETYGGNLMTIPIPAFVALILEDYSEAGIPFYATSIDRDEDDEGMTL